MTDVSVSVHAFGVEHFHHKVQNLDDRARHLHPALSEVASMMQRWLEQQFGTEGARAGNRWEKLAYVTIAKRGSDHPILFDTGRMFDEVLDNSNWLVTDDHLIFIATDEVEQYGRFHQSGTEKMPQRPIFDFTPRDHREVRDSIRHYLVTGRI